jgi:hypothetical protein
MDAAKRRLCREFAEAVKNGELDSGEMVAATGPRNPEAVGSAERQPAASSLDRPRGALTRP